MGRLMCRRRLPLNEWITNLARSTFAVDAGCTFALGRLDGRSDGKLDGTVFAIAVDKNAPSSHTYLANTARYAVVGQAKNRSPVRHLPAFECAPMTCSVSRLWYVLFPDSQYQWPISIVYSGGEAALEGAGLSR
jgi:hypothetical protein